VSRGDPDLGLHKDTFWSGRSTRRLNSTDTTWACRTSSRGWTRSFYRRRTRKPSIRSSPKTALALPSSRRRQSHRTLLQNVWPTCFRLRLSCGHIRLGDCQSHHGVNFYTAWLLSHPALGNQAVICPLAQQVQCQTRWWGWWRRRPHLHAGSYSFTVSSSTALWVLRRQPLLKWPAFPHCQHTIPPVLQLSAGNVRVPVGALVPPRSLVGSPAAASAASGFRAWLTGPMSDLSPPMTRCCFSYRYLTPTTNACETSFWMETTGKPTRARCANCCCKLLKWLTVQLNSGLESRPVGRCQMVVSVTALQGPTMSSCVWVSRRVSFYGYLRLYTLEGI
jgi:hypothetical protein